MCEIASGSCQQAATKKLSATAVVTLKLVQCMQRGLDTETDTRSLVQRCFSSTEAIKAIRDGEPTTATSTFTQSLSSGH